MQQHPARAGLRFEPDGEAASEELGLADALSAGSTRRCALGEGGEHSFLRYASRLRAEGRVDGVERGGTPRGTRSPGGSPGGSARRAGGRAPWRPRARRGAGESASPGARGSIRPRTSPRARRAARSTRDRAGREGPRRARRLRIEIREPQDRLELARRLGAAARGGERRAGREPGGDVVGMLARAAEGLVEIRSGVRGAGPVSAASSAWARAHQGSAARTRTSCSRASAARRCAAPPWRDRGVQPPSAGSLLEARPK